MSSSWKSIFGMNLYRGGLLTLLIIRTVVSLSKNPKKEIVHTAVKLFCSEAQRDSCSGNFAPNSRPIAKIFQFSF